MRFAGLGSLGGIISDANLQILARDTTLPVGQLRTLVENGGLWINLDSNGDLIQYGANTLDAALALVDTGGFPMEPAATQTANPTVNNAVRALEFLNVPVADVDSGAVFARYGMTDPALVAAVKTAYHNYLTWQAASKAEGDAAMRRSIITGVTAVIGGGLAANYLFNGAFTAGAQAAAPAAADASAVYGAGGGELTAADIAAGNAWEASAALPSVAQIASSTLPGAPGLTSAALQTAIKAGLGVGAAALTRGATGTTTRYGTPAPVVQQPGLLSGANTNMILLALAGVIGFTMLQKPDKRGK